MEIGKAFSYVFEDEKWINKVLIGALFTLLSVIIIGMFFVLGYAVQTIRNVAEGNPRPLPEWDNLGDKLGKGFSLFVVMFIYALPLIVIILCTTVPANIISGTAGDNGAASGLAGFLSLIGGCLTFIYEILLALIFPAILVRFATTGSISACFQFGQIISFITANIGNYIIVVLLSIVAYIIAGLGVIACIVGVFVTSFYAYLVMAHLFGQLARLSGPGEIRTV